MGSVSFRPEKGAEGEVDPVLVVAVVVAVVVVLLAVVIVVTVVAVAAVAAKVVGDLPVVVVVGDLPGLGSLRLHHYWPRGWVPRTPSPILHKG